MARVFEGVGAFEAVRQGRRTVASSEHPWKPTRRSGGFCVPVAVRYLTDLDLKVAKGLLAKPTYQDPGLDVLIERGRQHEQGYLEHLAARGLAINPY